jgi:hypothetical protein
MSIGTNKIGFFVEVSSPLEKAPLDLVAKKITYLIN